MTFEVWAEPYKSGEKPIPDHIHDWLREAWNAADKAAREECADLSGYSDGEPAEHAVSGRLAGVG